MSIQDKAMLVSLTIKQWAARKYDKRVSHEVAQTHNTDVDVGRYNKQLIEKTADSTLKALTKKAGELRTWHYENTLPWLQAGDRILPRANYFEYVAKYQQFKGEIEALADTFAAEYPKLVEAAQKRLNGMFNPADYPGPTAIRSKFEVKIDFLPIPSASDWRVELSEAEETAIKAQIEETAQRATETAMQDLWTRLYDVVDHIRERLSDPDKRFKDSLLLNAHELCDLLPRLNVTNDPNLNSMADEVRRMIGTTQPSDLRESGKNETWKLDRTMLAKDASDLADSLRGYF